MRRGRLQAPWRLSVFLLGLSVRLPLQFAGAARTRGATNRELRGANSSSSSQNHSHSLGLLRRGTTNRTKQPERCLLYGAICNGFEGACASDFECTTDKCYEGKCAMTPSCRTYGKSCYQYAPHSCCTGNCKPVTLVSDCLRLLGLTNDYSTHGGVNVDRQCANLGVCQGWPGQPVPPGPQTTPWAVDPQDLASKYYNLPGITFSTDAIVDTSKMIARRLGQTYENIQPDTVNVVGMKDAGLVFMSEDSKVELDMWAKFQMGHGSPDEVETYCVAPILRGGAGGAFYAAGKRCCDEDAGFNCGDAGKPGAACIIITSETDKFQYARQQVENLYGKKYHGGGKGVEPEVPYFCFMAIDYSTEMTIKRLPEDTLYSYKPLAKTTYCAAPVLRSSKDISKPIEFFAVGEDCCNLGDGSFTCGDVGVEGARSGKTDVDMTADFRTAVQMGEIRFGYTSVPKPMFVRWEKEVLVPDELTGPEIKLGKGARSMVKDAHKALLL